MLHPNTGIDLGREVDEVRKENAALRADLAAANAQLAEKEEQVCKARVDVVFDGPPSHESGRFVEVENSEGVSINFGKWVHRPDGYWALRFDAALSSSPCRHEEEAKRLREAVEWASKGGT